MDEELDPQIKLKLLEVSRAAEPDYPDVKKGIGCGAAALVLALLVYYVVVGIVQPNWGVWLAIPVVLAHLGLLGLGCGIIISSLTTKYRDLAILVSFGVQLWMYITPIVYPMSQLDDGTIKTILMINPVTAPVELLRYAVLGQGAIMPGYLALSAAVTVAVVLFGIMIFNKVEKTFMDTV